MKCNSVCEMFVGVVVCLGSRVMSEILKVNFRAKGSILWLRVLQYEHMLTPCRYAFFFFYLCLFVIFWGITNRKYSTRKTKQKKQINAKNTTILIGTFFFFSFLQTFIYHSPEHLIHIRTVIDSISISSSTWSDLIEGRSIILLSFLNMEQTSLSSN